MHKVGSSLPSSYSDEVKKDTQTYLLIYTHKVYHMFKIIFVDGPNGSGKDYFINNLVHHYKENNPHKNVETMHLSQYTGSVRDLTGSRFTDKTNTLVFLRHINALTDLKKACWW